MLELRHRSVPLSAVLLILATSPALLRADDPPRTDFDWPKNSKDAAKFVESLPSTQPADLDAGQNVRLAWSLSRYEGRSADALRHLDAALKRDPHHYKAHELAGLIHASRGDDDRAASHFLELMTVDRPESALYFSVIDDLNTGVTFRNEYIRRLRAAIDDPAVGEPYRADLRWNLAFEYVGAGRLDEAKATFEAVGFWRDWMVIGPFDNERNAGFSQICGPESEIDYAKEYPGRDRPVRWQRLRNFERSGRISFYEIMYPQENTLAYALTFIHAPEDANVVFRFGAANAVKLWVNERLLLADDLDKSFSFDQYTVPARLHAGWNKLLVKVCERDGSWHLGLRITNPDGSLYRSAPDDDAAAKNDDGPLPIRKTPDDRADKNEPDFEFARGAYETFSERAKRNPRDPQTLYYLARAERATQRHEPAVATLEKLTRRTPRCAEHFRLLADAYEDDEKPDKQLAALKRALEIEPDDVAALVRLGQFYHHTEKREQAIEALDRAIKLNPRCIDARAVRQIVYEAKEWHEHAFRAARQLAADYPDVGGLARNYAERAVHMGYRALARRQFERAVECKHDDVTSRRALARLAEERGDIDGAAAQIRELLRGEPLESDARLALARLLARNERFDEALAECDVVSDICPENANAHRQRGAILQRMNRDEEALESWKLALRYNPDDRWLREYVEFLEPQAASLVSRYAVTDVQAADLIRRRVDPADFPKADAYELLDHLVTEINEDGSYTSLEHRIIQILNDNGREAFTSIRLRGSVSKILRAVVIQPDGSEVEATNVSQRGIAFGKLQVGSILRTVVQYRGSSTEWLSRHYTATFSFKDAYPKLRAEFILLVPKSRRIRYRVQGDSIRLEEQELALHRLYRWRADDVSMIEPERNRPPMADIAELVSVSTIEDWDEIARWEHALTKEAFVADDAVRRKAAELTQRAKSREEKIRALANFVSQKIQYRQDYGRLIMGIVPHKAGNVLAKEAGDCKDKAALLITMLREVGIPACYVTLRTYGSGRLHEELPSNQCDHAIVFVPDEDDPSRGIYIDGTADESGIDTLPWQDQGCRALVFSDDGKMTFHDTPVATAEASTSRLVLDTTLNTDGSAKISARWTAVGQWAILLRSSFKVTGMRERRLEQFANTYYPGAKLLGAKFSDLSDRDSPVEIEFEFTAPNVAEVSGRRLVVRPRQFLEMTRRYADRTERNYDVWLPYTNAVVYEERYRVPIEYKPVELPKPRTMKTDWIDVHCDVRRAGADVTLTKRVRFHRRLIPRDDYDALRKLCVDTDRLEREPVEFERAAPAGDENP